MKAKKQDGNIERPEARGDGSDPAGEGRGASRRGGADWSYIGDVPGSILSPFKWYRLLMSFYEGPRDPTEPFFLSRDRVRPYTYAAASADLNMYLTEVSPEDTE